MFVSINSLRTARPTALWSKVCARSDAAALVGQGISPGLVQVFDLAAGAAARAEAVAQAAAQKAAVEQAARMKAELDKLAGYAVRYFTDKVKPTKSFRAPTDRERVALKDLHEDPDRVRKPLRRTPTGW